MLALFNHKRILNTVVFFAFLASILYSFVYRIVPEVDARAYDNIAVNLSSGNGFKELAEQNFQHDYSIVRAGPGYEFFLAGLYFVFGHHYEFVWVAQAILHSLSVFFIYRISLIVFFDLSDEYKERVALIAAFLFAFWPDLIEISAMLMTETLYLFLTILVLYLFFRVYENPDKIFLAVLLGVSTGLAVLTRPPIIFFVPFVIFFFYSAKQYRALFYYLTLFSLVLCPWVIRNYVIYDQFILTTLIGEYNLWVGNTLLADGGQISGGFNPVVAYMNEHGWSGMSSAAKSSFYEFISTHPLVFIKLCFVRLMMYFSLIRPMGFWFYQTGLKQILFVASSGLWIAGVFVTGMAGVIHFGKIFIYDFRSQFEKFGQVPLSKISYLILFSITAPLPLVITVVESRYRFQIYPFLALFAGYAINMLKQNKKILKNKTLLTSFFILSAISICDMVYSREIVLDHIRQLFS